MEKHTLTDLIYAYRNLSEIKKPSAKVKECIQKLEQHIHLTIMSIQRMGPVSS